MKIAFAILAHGKAADVGRLVRTLVSQDHHVVLHYDLKSPAESYCQLGEMFRHEQRVRFARRVRVEWGGWSVVEGTLNCLDQIEEAGWEPDYVFLASGTDYPIRPSVQLEAFLQRNRGDEFIESVPSDTVRWVKTGPQRERYRYRWYYNWRHQPWRTEAAFLVQRLLHLERPFVRGLRPHIGSQWWVLTWRSLRAIMALSREPDIRRFFSTVLVPDELFFQTMLAHAAPWAHVVDSSLTLYQFSDYGFPVVFHADHIEYLCRQPFFMARKLSQHTGLLRDTLDATWRSEADVAAFDDLNVGLVSPEYQDWRLSYRAGAPGLPLVGRSDGRWHGDQKRLVTPFFAVLGASTAELRLVYRALSWHPDLLCHGQLFHPAALEFAGGRPDFAGYRREDLGLRDVSAPNFLADVVRAEERRMSGLLLRWGQGAHMGELLLQRPNVRIVVVDADPLTAFVETLLGQEPLLDGDFDLQVLRAVPPRVAANRFRRFLGEHAAHAAWLGNQIEKGRPVKPRGWVHRVTLSAEDPDWLKRIEACLGTSLASAPETATREAIAREMEAMTERRAVATELLVRGGIGRAVLETLTKQPDQPLILLALM